MKYKLYSPEQGHSMMLRIWAEAKELLTSDKKLVIEVKEETRSNGQNSLIHALIARIAKQAEHAGSKLEAEDWKRLLLDQWAKDSNRDRGALVASLSGDGIIQLGLQSRKLSKSEGAEFIEFVYAWAAQSGIDLV
jgi:hypothetical protein